MVLTGFVFYIEHNSTYLRMKYDFFLSSSTSTFAHSLLLLFSSCSSIGEHWFFAFLCHNRLRGCRPVSTLARWRPVCVWAAVNVRGQAAREENTRVQKEPITTLAFCILVLFFLPPALREMYWKVAGTRARDVTAGRCLSSLLTWEEEREKERAHSVGWKGRGMCRCCMWVCARWRMMCVRRADTWSWEWPFLGCECVREFEDVISGVG